MLIVVCDFLKLLVLPLQFHPPINQHQFLIYIAILTHDLNSINLLILFPILHYFSHIPKLFQVDSTLIKIS